MSRSRTIGPIAAAFILLAGCASGPASFDLDAGWSVDNVAALLALQYDSESPDSEREEVVECAPGLTADGFHEMWLSSEPIDSSTPTFTANIWIWNVTEELLSVNITMNPGGGAPLGSGLFEDDSGNGQLNDVACTLVGVYPDLDWSLDCVGMVPLSVEYAYDFTLSWTCPVWDNSPV